MMTSTDRRMARAMAELNTAAGAALAARAVEESAADAEAGTVEQVQARSAARVLRTLSAHGISRAGRIVDRKLG
ncbi:hypothetical protein VQH23_07565 [Pararoseomonas sp. SCSIO 73927]|uniref:hypothetical protein n=1 Tax=Pararoseomonas sp. SCSIO 73927 TaxID=3114537 RepID=UPI0030CF9AAE